jgi:FkbM family methyltransferase
MDLMKSRSLKTTEMIRIAISMIRLATRRTTVEVPFHGVTVVADLKTPHGLGIYRYRHRSDVDADPDLSLVERHLSPGDVFIDCGANVGMFTVAGASKVEREGLVVSFEPVPETRAALERNITVNVFNNVIVLPHALSDVRTQRTFFVAANGAGLSSFAPAVLGIPITVQTLRPDDVLPLLGSRKVSVLKMDIEGAEVAALRGAKRLLSEHQPVLLVEVEDRHLRRQHSSAEELYELLESLGYHPATGGQPPNVLFTPSRPNASLRQV